MVFLHKYSNDYIGDFVLVLELSKNITVTEEEKFLKEIKKAD